jgi:hypothetical protein
LGCSVLLTLAGATAAFPKAVDLPKHFERPRENEYDDAVKVSL